MSVFPQFPSVEAPPRLFSFISRGLPVNSQMSRCLETRNKGQVSQVAAESARSGRKPSVEEARDKAAKTLEAERATNQESTPIASSLTPILPRRSPDPTSPRAFLRDVLFHPPSESHDLPPTTSFLFVLLRNLPGSYVLNPAKCCSEHARASALHRPGVRDAPC